MDLIEKYIGEAKRLKSIIRVIDKKTGNKITTMDTKTFIKAIEDEY